MQRNQREEFKEKLERQNFDIRQKNKTEIPLSPLMGGAKSKLVPAGMNDTFDKEELKRTRLSLGSDVNLFK